MRAVLTGIVPRELIIWSKKRAEAMTTDGQGIGRDRAQGQESSFVIRTFLLIVITVCAGLALSAAYNFVMLSRLASEYLHNQARDIANSMDSQARGPGRRRNTVFWKSLIDERMESSGSGTIAFIALLDGAGAPVASSKDFDAAVLKIAPGSAQSGVYAFNFPLMSSSQMGMMMGSPVAGWQIRLGLRASAVHFIRRQAVSQAVVAAAAMIVLAILSYTLLRNVRRFIALQNREQSNRHLRMLGTMAASLAHEIRNPLGAMKGLTQLAQEELPRDHAAQPQLQTVVSEAERLEKLVTDLLDFARAKEPQISEFDLAALISDIESMLNSRPEASKVAIRIPANPNPLILRSDPAGLRQVLLNVLINAIEATPQGETVTLTTMLDESHKSIIIRVDDSGKGLGSRIPDELVQPFVTTKMRGTGLGLAISKQIIESLGGSLNLENLSGGGARCSLKLPLVRLQADQ
jgi:signal transduction histidine kinase